MLRKLMLPLATALALTGCLTANGPADYSADQDPESESEFVPSTHTGREPLIINRAEAETLDELDF